MIGNILVIISVFTYTPLKITPNYFIVSLAMADLTVSACVLPFNIVHSVLGRWIFGSTFCKMWLTFDVLCCTASILNLCAIALDRFYALHDPIEHARRRTVNFVLGMIALVWLLSCLICLPPVIGWNDWPVDWNDETPCELSQNKGYVIYSAMGSFYIPLAIIMFVYFKIFQNTRNRLRKRRAQTSNLQVLSQSNSNINKSTKIVTKIVSPKNGHSNSPNSRTTQIPEVSTLVTKQEIAQEKSSGLHQEAITPVGHSNQTSTDMHKFINEKAKISLSKERKAARTMAVIVTTFIVCWLPFFLMYVILPFCGDSCIRDPKVINLLTWLGYVNSTLNPIIYTIFNMDFRVAFKRIISCVAFRN